VQYTYNNTTFSDATTVCDLGVDVDSSLTYDGHINRMALSIVIWFFYAKHTLFTLDLYSNTRPVWSPYFTKYVNCIENVQRHFTKRIVSIYDLSYLER